MTIREYWDKMYAETTTDEEFDEVVELENVIFRVLEDNEDDFTIWAIEEGIDLDAVEVVMDEEIPVLTLWYWDHCEE